MKKALVVDDELDAVEVLRWFLEDWGYEVKTAGAGQAALEVGREYRPDLLITDYFLSDDLNGLGVIRELRSSAPRMAAILVTGMRPEHFRHEILGLEDVPIVHKPFSFNDLQQMVLNLETAR